MILEIVDEMKIAATATLWEAKCRLEKISYQSVAQILFVFQGNQCLGVMTQGDIDRALERVSDEASIERYYHQNPVFVKDSVDAWGKAQTLMAERKEIHAIGVLDEAGYPIHVIVRADVKYPFTFVYQDESFVKNFFETACPSGFETAPVPSMTSVLDRKVLYRAVRLKNPHKLLEIGCFMGGSTSIIAKALLRNNERFRFDVVDLFDIDHYHPLLLHKLASSHYAELSVRNDLRKSFLDRLSMVGLDKMVTSIIKADFNHYDFAGQYDFIFADVTHDVDEIDKNGRKINELLAPGGMLVCHDVGGRYLTDLLLRYVPCESYFCLDKRFDNSVMFVGTKA
jgi:predicted O-methyltransferase YrrM